NPSPSRRPLPVRRTEFGGWHWLRKSVVVESARRLGTRSFPEPKAGGRVADCLTHRLLAGGWSVDLQRYDQFGAAPNWSRLDPTGDVFRMTAVRGIRATPCDVCTTGSRVP